ncbi:uncharacterized protein [Chironomus tepperi]|uniref:uncharacterized protein isoform X3 n=1 Tax=Chironomus tepperi TaxID=113505 RepID=UPI00391F7D02
MPFNIEKKNKVRFIYLFIIAVLNNDNNIDFWKACSEAWNADGIYTQQTSTYRQLDGVFSARFGNWSLKWNKRRLKLVN